MKVRGNLDLVLNELKNIKIDVLTADPSGSDLVAGRFWFNSTEKCLKYFDGTEIKCIAVGGDVDEVVNNLNNLQTEVDNIETGLGFENDGTFGGFSGTNYLDTASTVVNAINILDGKIKENADAIAQEVSDRQTAISNLQTEVDNIENGLGFNADGTFGGFSGTYFIDGKNIVDAISTLDTEVKNRQNEISQIDLQWVYDNTAPDAEGAAAIKLATGKDFRIYDDDQSTIYFQVDSETGKVTITGDLEVLGNTSVVESQITDADHWLISPASGTTIGLEINPDEGVTFTTDIVRVRPSHDGPICFRIGPDGMVYVCKGTVTDYLVFPDQTVTGQSLGGNTAGEYDLGHKFVSDVVVKDGTNTLTEGTDYTVDYENGKITLLHDTTNVPTVDYKYHPSVDGRNIAADGAKLDAHIAGTDYKHNANVIVYDNSTSGLSATDVQAALDELASRTAGQAADIQSELDNVEASVGLNADGTLPEWGTDVNYIGSTTTVIDAVKVLDGQVKTNADNLAQEIADRQAGDQAIRDDLASTQAGKGANLVGITASLNNATGASTVEAALEGLDAAISNNASDISDLINVIGAGELANVDFASNNFITDGTNLISNISILDQALKTYMDNIASTQAGKGANLVGVTASFANAPDATTVEGVLEAFDTAISNAGKRYEFVASAADTEFVVNHNLGYLYVNVTVYDADTNEVIIPDSIQVIDSANVKVTFTQPVRAAIKIVA